MRYVETYIGDGAYIYLDDSRDIVLYTSDGVRETNRVVLDPHVMINLRSWFDKLDAMTDEDLLKSVETG